MRVLILNHYAPPEPAPTAELVEGIPAALAQNGHAVTIVGTNRIIAGAIPFKKTETRPNKTNQKSRLTNRLAAN